MSRIAEALERIADSLETLARGGPRCVRENKDGVRCDLKTPHEMQHQADVDGRRIYWW